MEDRVANNDSSLPDACRNGTVGEECGRKVTRKQALRVPSNVTMPDKVIDNRNQTCGNVTMPDKVIDNRNQTCGCAPDGNRRSCLQCLNQVLPDHGCALTSDAQCVDASEYNWNLDYNSFHDSNNTIANSILHFAAVNTTYCSYRDPVCSACREAWSNPSVNPELADLPFCRGQDGCVCLRSCWLQRDDFVANTTCLAPQLAGAPKQSWTTWGIGVVAILAIAAFLMVMLRDHEARVELQAAQTRLRRANFSMPTGDDTAGIIVESLQHLQARAMRPRVQRPQLQLAGWQALREQLIESERVNFEPLRDGKIASISGDFNPNHAFC